MRVGQIKGVDYDNDDATPGRCPLPESRCWGRVVVSLVQTRLAGAVTLLLLAAPFATVVAQPPEKVARLGYLGPASRPTTGTVDAFLQGLRESGWVDGKNIVIEYRWAEGRTERLPDLAAELVRLKVDVILAGSTAAAVAAKNVTATIPIVMATGSDVEKLGLASSLAHPGANVTGLTYGVGPDQVGKQLELLKETVPKVRRVAILWNPANPTHPSAIKIAKVAARALGVHLQFLDCHEPSNFDRVFAAMVRERAGALLILTDPVFFGNRARLLALVGERRLPAMTGQRVFTEAGGLMSFGVDANDNFRRSAKYVDKILKGAKPADLPIEQPTRFELVINVKTAGALGLTIPPSLLLRADQVIE